MRFIGRFFSIKKGGAAVAVRICGVEPGSPAHKAKIQAGGELLAINGQEIVDVLDYRF